MIGLDTGFFIRLFENNKQAVNVWDSIISDENIAIVSSLTLFELDRLFLRTTIEREKTLELINNLQDACDIYWIDNLEVLIKASKISHSCSIPTVDAIILACFVLSGAKQIYTTDSHLLRYVKKRTEKIEIVKI